jgi:hypothetical protein
MRLSLPWSTVYAGYEVIRMGAKELEDEAAKSNVKFFFDLLHRRYDFHSVCLELSNALSHATR